MAEQQRLTSQDQVEHFDRLSADYKKIHDKALFLAGGDSDHFYQAKIKILKANMTSEPKAILDFGCGTGRLTELLAQNFPSAKIVGIDPSLDSIDSAKKDYAQFKNISWSTDLEILRKTSGQFDLVVAAGVFHHIPPSERAENLKLVHSAMKDNGQLYIFEHNGFSLLTRLLLLIAGNDKGAVLLTGWGTKSVLQSVGFVKTKIQYISFFPKFFGPLLAIEPFLTWCPLGAQFYALTKKESRK